MRMRAIRFRARHGLPCQGMIGIASGVVEAHDHDRRRGEGYVYRLLRFQ